MLALLPAVVLVLFPFVAVVALVFELVVDGTLVPLEELLVFALDAVG